MSSISPHELINKALYSINALRVLAHSMDRSLVDAGALDVFYGHLDPSCIPIGVNSS